MKKFTASFLAFSILSLSGNLFAENKGADLEIQKIDGTQVRGELIAVKKSSLLLIERDSGVDMSVDIAAVKIIRVVKKSKFLKGAGIGLLIGGGLGFVLASVLLERDDWYGIGVAGGGILGSILGLPIGAGIGLSAGTDKTIQFEGRSELEIQEILEKLSKKARIRNVQ